MDNQAENETSAAEDVRGITAHDVSLSYEMNGDSRIPVFHQQSFRIEPGEFICIVGPSGCGKTSLLRLIGGLQEPTSGAIEMGGESPQEALRDRRIAFLFQRPVLLSWKTVAQNAELAGRLWNDSGIGVKASKALDLVGLDGFRDAYPKQLSGGMQSRVAIARALAQSPRIMLMDEPFSALDEVTRARLNLELLDIWHQERPTIVFVTHLVSEAAFLADRVLVMGERPEGVVLEVEVDIPRPRSYAIMDTLEYLEALRRIRRGIGLAANGAKGGGA